jgi:hypothetical protein
MNSKIWTESFAVFGRKDSVTTQETKHLAYILNQNKLKGMQTNFNSGVNRNEVRTREGKYLCRKRSIIFFTKCDKTFLLNYVVGYCIVALNCPTSARPASNDRSKFEQVEALQLSE